MAKRVHNVEARQTAVKANLRVSKLLFRSKRDILTPYQGCSVDGAMIPRDLDCLKHDCPVLYNIICCFRLK
jgi:hypothetical protein